MLASIARWTQRCPTLNRQESRHIDLGVFNTIAVLFGGSHGRKRLGFTACAERDRWVILWLSLAKSIDEVPATSDLTNDNDLDTPELR